MALPEQQPRDTIPTLEIVELEEPHFDRLGVAAEMTAHALSLTRAAGGIALARHIESTPDYQSWGTFGVFVALAATDGEGLLARWGRRRQAKDESDRRPFNSYVDLFGDKVLIDTVTRAIGKREVKNGNSVYGTTVKQVATVDITRDVATSVDRIVADIQRIDTRAQPSGKKKALKQYAVTAAALTPWAKSVPAKAVLGLGFAYTAGESVKSGWSLHKSFRKQRRTRQAD